MTHTYTIAKLFKKPTSGVVKRVYYNITTEANGESNITQYKLDVTGSESDPGFIAYDSLTEADVLSWVNSNKPPTIEMQASQSFEKYISLKDVEDGDLPW